MLDSINKGIIVFRKDMRLEFRTRYALNAIFMFAVTTVVAISMTIGPVELRSFIAAPLLWVVLFFAAMSGLAHIFIREEEQQTADMLRLVAPPTAVWFGKWLFNVCLMFALEIVIVPLFAVFINFDVQNLAILIPILIFGTIGLASASTILAAIVSQASARGALFAVLSFPITLPVMVFAINGTRLALDGAAFSDCISDLQVLISFSVIIITISVMVFEFVWSE